MSAGGLPAGAGGGSGLSLSVPATPARCPGQLDASLQPEPLAATWLLL